MEEGPDFCPCGASSPRSKLGGTNLSQIPTPSSGTNTCGRPFSLPPSPAPPEGIPAIFLLSLAQTSWPLADTCTQHFPWANTLSFPNIRQGPWKACRFSEALCPSSELHKLTHYCAPFCLLSTLGALQGWASWKTKHKWKDVLRTLGSDFTACCLNDEVIYLQSLANRTSYEE